MQSLLAYEERSGHQIVVHTTPSLEGLEIEDYSIAIAEAWKIGHEGLDNGVILTVAPNERRVRIEVGYGLEGVLPDAIGKRIIEEVILPEFRAGDLGAGVIEGVRHIQAYAEGEPAPPRPRSTQRRTPGFNASKLIWLIVLLVFMGPRALFFLPFIGDVGRGGFGGGRGGGGFGGGGFGGGGGGFGGGGASGSW